MLLFLFSNVIYVFLLLWLCILIVCLCIATLTEGFPCFFLCCKANARVKPAKTGHGPHSSKCLCCSMYFCVVLLFLCCLFCVVLGIVCVYMCTVLLPRGGYPIAVKYIIYHIYIFAVALRPHAGHGLLILEVSRSHTTVHHSRYDSSGRVISSSQRPLPDNTHHSQETDIHAPGGIRIHNLSRRAAADLRLRPRGQWDRHIISYISYIT